MSSCRGLRIGAGLWPRCLTTAAVCLAALVGCDPNLELAVKAQALVVGQRLAISLTEGGDEAKFVDSSLTLTDADGTVFSAATGDDYRRVPTKRVDSGGASVLQVTMPRGIAPGSATLALTTSGGGVFSSTVNVRRLFMVRDLAGKIWVYALTGGASAVQQVGEIKAGKTGMGQGFGALAMGPDGVLLGSTAFGTVKRGYFGWSERLSGTFGYAETLSNINELALSAVDKVDATSGSTSRVRLALLATQKGVSVARVGSPIPTEINLTGSIGDVSGGSPLTEVVRRLVVARRQLRGALLAEYQQAGSSKKAYRVVAFTFTDTAGKAVKAFDLPVWSVAGKPEDVPAVATSADGRWILAANPVTNALALIGEGFNTYLMQSLSSGLKGPMAVAPAAKKGEFYVLCRSTNNLGVFAAGTKDSGGKSQMTLSWVRTIPLKPSAKAKSAVGVVSSDRDEVLVLYQGAVLQVNPTTSAVKPLALGGLFAGGEVGGSIVVQP